MDLASRNTNSMKTAYPLAVESTAYESSTAVLADLKDQKTKESSFLGRQNIE